MLDKAKAAGDKEAIALFESDLASLQQEKPIVAPTVNVTEKVQYSPTTEAARSTLQGLTFNFADELEAALRTGKISGAEYEALRNQLRAKQEQFSKEYPKTALASEVAGGLALPGGIFGLASKAPSIARTAAISSGIGGIQGYGGSTSSEEAPSDVIGGALTGGVVGGTLGTIGSAIAPKVQPQARQLQKEGISLTPGAAFGGQIQAVEQAAESLPVAGQLVKSARQQSFEEFNKAAFNRALKELDTGVTVPKDLPLREAADFTYGQISTKYNEIYPKVSLKYNNTIEKQFNALGKKYSEANLGKDAADQFQSQLNSIKKRLEGNKLSGGQVKALKEDLRMMTDAYKGSVGSEKLLGNALNDLENSIMLSLRNQNPEYASQLKKADTAYANYKRVESAAAAAKGAEGAFTPAQLETAIKQGGTKSQYARGKALMQDLSNPAYDVLGNKIPDSGTANRLALSGLLTGAAHYIEPTAAVPTALASGLYTKPGMSLFQKLISPRSPLVEKYGTKARAAIPFSGEIYDPFLQEILKRNQEE
jgi:hypothetical protein